MGVFSSGGIGVDFGSSNVTICLESEGVVLREPSFVLSLREDTDEVLAVGRDARQMLGRTPKDVVLLAPVMNGAVTDISLGTVLMQTLAEKAIGRRRALEKSRVIVTASQGATRVERAALEEVVRGTGAKRAALVRTPIAAAVGAGIPISEPKGTMVVVLGGATTEVAVLSMNGIVAARSLRTGGDALDEAIMHAIRRDKGLVIGRRTAEDLKIDLGTTDAGSVQEAEPVLLRGRDAATGKPATVEVTAADIHRAILPPIEVLLESIREAFENIPADLAGDILESGLHLSGGGALLEGLSERLSDLLGLPVHVGENPQDEIAIGACAIAADDRLAQRLEQTGCLTEL